MVDNIKGTYFKVLDKGFVGLIDYMGDDAAIEQAARTSYGKGTRKTSETRGLLRYLMRHRHSTPFEMAELKFHVKVPMDTWRQWIRHRTASVNEYSTRYSEAIDDNQQTNVGEWRLQSGSNKQGSDGYLKEWPPELVGEFQHKCFEMNSAPSFERGPGQYLSYREAVAQDYAKELYNERLSLGVAKEQARKDLPLSTYTIAYWKIDLQNLLHFLSLRLDSHAQLEIRQYAGIIAGYVKELFPLTWEAFEDYRLYSVNMSSYDMDVLQQIMHWAGNHLDNVDSHSLSTLEEAVKAEYESLGLQKREIDEGWNKLQSKSRIDYTLDFTKSFIPTGE